jgi:hypothetical protein
MLIRFSLIAAFCTVLLGIYSLTLMAQDMDDHNVRGALLEQELLSPVSFNNVPVTLDEVDPRSTVPLDLKDELETLNTEDNAVKEA